MDQNSSVDSAISTSKARSYKPTSMSSFSVESGAWEASTSGCSSLVDAKRQKTLKKQKVRQCLEELRLLVKPPKGRGKGGGGTLVTLQNVITQMKKYRDGGDAVSNVPAECMDPELLGSAQDGDGIDWPLSCDHTLESGDWFKVVLSMKECNVLEVPHELLRMLRYPNNYWFNQSLMEYIYKRDVVTVNTHLGMARIQSKQAAATSGGESPETSEQKNIFFFRIRHYKSIRHGFSLNRSEKYTVFCGQASRQKVQLNFPPGTPVEGLQADHIYPVLECTPIQSAYTAIRELPTHRTFLMRHTVHCNYIFLHPSSIPLTGYLPQEVIGTSIFDYYHPQDLLILLGIYQQIVAMPGKTLRSVPYRMRVKNGDYILLETEWSSFVNPWTNRIDFIICKHHVVGGPTNLDVFNEGPGSKRQMPEVCPQARSLQKHIRSVLLQRPARCSARPQRRRRQKRHSTSHQNRRPNRHATSHQKRTVQTPPVAQPTPQPQPEVDSKPSTPVCHSPTDEEVEVAGKPDDTFAEPNKPEQDVEETPELKGTAKLNFLENEKLLIYEQLNYAQNIRRFLLSCSLSLQGKSSSETTESDASDHEDITVDLSLPKPPSFASSTKALVSEREQLEEMPPSPTHEDILEDANAKTHADGDVYQPVTLTEDVIALHNRQQRQQYIEKMVREKTSLVSVQGQGLRIIRESGKAKKRVHPKDKDEPVQNVKASRKDEAGTKWSQTDPSQLLYPREEQSPASVNHLSMQGGQYTGKLSQQQQVPVMNMPRGNFVSMSNISGVGPNYVLCQPMSNAKTQLITVGTSGAQANQQQQQQMLYQNTPSSNVNAMQVTQWPYYDPQNYQQSVWPRVISGLSYVPQIVYQPIPGSYFPPITARPVLNVQRSASAAVPAAAGAPTKESYTDIEENTSTESKDNDEKEESEKLAEKKSVEGSDSQSAEETSSSMLYLLDSANNSSLSESDDQQNKSLMINSMSSVPPWRANVKWSKELEMDFKMPSVNIQQVLKADRMFLAKMRQCPQVLEQIDELIGDPTKTDCILLDDDNLLGTTMEHGSDCGRKKPSSAKVDLDTEQSTASPKSEPDAGETAESLEEKNEKTVSDSDSSDGAVSKDSGELTLSDITPSDQRSHDDAPSSAKESDMMSSSDNGQSPIPKETESRTSKRSTTPKALMSKVFVPLNIERQAACKSAPLWLQNTTFNDAVQLQYNKPQHEDVDKVLAMDQAQLKSMNQSELVHEQFDELMVQLKNQIMLALTPLNANQDAELSEGSGCSGEWGNIIQSSSGSSSSDGKLFPYSCERPEETNKDTGNSLLIGESSFTNSTKEFDCGDSIEMKDVSNVTLHSAVKTEGVKSDCSVGESEAKTGSYTTESNSLLRDTSYMTEKRNCPEAAVQSELTDVASNSVGSKATSVTDKSTDNNTGSEENRESGSNMGESSEGENCRLSLQATRNSVDSQDTCSIHSGHSVPSVTSIHSCCSPKVFIAEMVGNKAGDKTSAEGTNKDASEEKQKHNAVLMMKNLFTSDEDVVVMHD